MPRSRVRRRLPRGDGRRGHPRAARARHRPEVEKLRGDLRPPTRSQDQEDLKRLKVLEAFQQSGIKPEWMILEVLPVLPPDLRPLVPLDGALRHLRPQRPLPSRHQPQQPPRSAARTRAPDIIVRNEKRMLQEAVDALFDNGRRGKAMTGANKRPLKSLADMIKGQGAASARTCSASASTTPVVRSSPSVRSSSCTSAACLLMALELFKPFIFNKLELMGLRPPSSRPRRWWSRRSRWCGTSSRR